MNARWNHLVSRKPDGFSLVEILVGLLITGMIMGGISTAIIQMLSINNQNTNAITAQRQVQQVGHAMSTDGLQARTIRDNANDAHLTDMNPFTWPLTFSWIGDDGRNHDITYELIDNVVSREETIGSTTTTRDIATDISTAVFSRFGTDTYRLVVTSSINGKYSVTETRTYEIKLRAIS